MKCVAVFSIFLLFVCDYSQGVFLRSLSRFRTLDIPVENVDDAPKEQYFDQILDHFDPSNTLTWKQRYFENGTFYKRGGPIFLMINGESEASANWTVEGAWINYAQKYRALCILLEHRFYGKSHPTEDLSTKNLSYLSSEQALADIAWFISSFNKKNNLGPSTKWIVFGGSYAGSLAAWMRLKYPHLVQGAVSASGPLVAIADFEEYFRVVRDSLMSYHPDCVTAVERGTSQLSSSISDPKIHKLFKLCDPLDVKNQNDVSSLFEALASNFAGIVQYNKDNRHGDSPAKNMTISRSCEIMLNKTLGPEMNRLAEINSVMLNISKEPCLDYKYDKSIAEMKETKWDSKAAGAMRQWIYQTCTEFGFYQTSALNNTKRMFGDQFPLEFFLKQCSDIYGSKFDVAYVKKAIDKTNSMYGGLDNQAVNVVYVHGSVDPWYPLGITKTLKKGAPAIFINGTAHCADMYPPSPSDLPQLTAARKEIEKLIGEWLSQ